MKEHDEEEDSRSATESQSSADVDFVVAAQTGDVKKLKSLINKISEDDTMGYALRWAAINGHESITNYLLENGADVNEQSATQDTALTQASSNGHFEIVKILIKNGADVNIANEDGNTPLIWAAYKNNLEMVQYLVEHGAEVNKANNDGSVAAAFTSDEEISSYLQEKSGGSSESDDGEDAE